MNDQRRMRTVVLGVLLALVFALSARADGLHILLTNDDGIDSPGVAVFAEKFRTAGHRVTIVAPRSQESGTGAHVSFGPVPLERLGPERWAVDGRPADAALIGIQSVLDGDPPDLMISGPNFGQNLGANIVNSGTVGAAMMAVQLDVPAMAISVGIDLTERRAEPVHYPTTVATFPLAADFALQVVAKLVQHREETGHLLAPGLLLNLNVPLSGPRTPRVVSVGRYGGFRLKYPALDADGAAPDTVRTQFAYDDRGFTDHDSDTEAFHAGFITVSVVEPPWPTIPVFSQALARWLSRALSATAVDGTSMQ